jgi:peptide-methionine (R)-S-oxide reductase
LTPEQYAVLRNSETEFAGTSELNNEYRAGIYVCAGCDLPLFKSDWKYDSRTGWPSYWAAIHEHRDNTGNDLCVQGARRIPVRAFPIPL